MSAQPAEGPEATAEYRSAFYPDHALEAFGVWREPGREGQYGGYAGQATWRGKDGTTATTYCGCPHFTADGALACIKRQHEVRPSTPNPSSAAAAASCSPAACGSASPPGARRPGTTATASPSSPTCPPRATAQPPNSPAHTSTAGLRGRRRKPSVKLSLTELRSWAGLELDNARARDEREPRGA